MEASLRALLAHQFHRLSQSNRHVDLPDVCNQLGLAPPPGPDSGSKAERMASALVPLPDAGLSAVAERLLEFFPPSPKERNEIEEVLWIDAPVPNIPKRYRRELARTLQHNDLYMDASRFDQLLGRLWVLYDDSMLGYFDGVDNSLGGHIERHVYENPGDWSPEHLFDALGAFDCTGMRFVQFIEGLASADIRPDEAEQRRFASKVNDSLCKCGVQLRETAEEGGYPVFTLESLTSGSRGRPKNLIFASPDKPDLRFSDAVNNDIEIVTNADKVLAYDRPIGAEGLRWRELQAWWADIKGLDSAEDAKRSLYRRLHQSLPANSPPQQFLFRSFFESFGTAIPGLPALLPEVWLYWDPKTVRERGAAALTRFRMDFLLLLPANVRVVIEVDGKHHYAEADGKASAKKYATMVAGDRDMRLSGYEVYRFGAHELNSSGADDVVRDFFSSLFKRYSVIIN